MTVIVNDNQSLLSCWKNDGHNKKWKTDRHLRTLYFSSAIDIGDEVMLEQSE